MLHNKIALIAGIGPGLGLAAARTFAKQGARVVLMARRHAALEEARLLIEKEGGQAVCHPGDVRDPAACKAAVQTAVESYGGLDVLVANAFYASAQASPTSTTLEDWRDVLDVNLLGPLSLAKAAAPLMTERGGGSIIMVASNQVLEVIPGFSAYAASKWGLVSLTRHLAQELGVHNIRVNVVHPGLIMGDSVRAYIRSLAKEEGVAEEVAHRRIVEKAALKRVAEPEEIADSLVFFASDLSRLITGQSLCVDGGVSFH